MHAHMYVHGSASTSSALLPHEHPAQARKIEAQKHSKTYLRPNLQAFRDQAQGRPPTLSTRESRERTRRTVIRGTSGGPPERVGPEVGDVTIASKYSLVGCRDVRA